MPNRNRNYFNLVKNLKYLPASLSIMTLIENDYSIKIIRPHVRKKRRGASQLNLSGDKFYIFVLRYERKMAR